MRDVPAVLTMEQLVALTRIRTCESCGLDHAAVRTCEETRVAAEVASTHSKLKGYLS